MQGGDISNETPPRIIVVIDVVTESELVDERKLLRSSTERKLLGINRVALSQLWNMSNKYGLSVELAAFADEHWTEKQLEAFIDKLERRGANPFNYHELYSDVHDFVSDLPYRPNLKGVVDLRERVAMYGSWGIELANL